MRFLFDECAGPVLAGWLREQNHETFSVYEEARGMDDDSIIEKAFSENWILVTCDKDFGEKVYRKRRPHKGVVLLRLEDERAAGKIAAIKRLIESHSGQLASQFVVVTERQVRFARISG
ncbi:MAG: DUF5615 family PIN-like protein [Deltaproteobacteria bacterium]|nr:DUF5615 family PIN-like protein [Deltaproteobacteria bacterium]